MSDIFAHEFFRLFDIDIFDVDFENVKSIGTGTKSCLSCTANQLRKNDANMHFFLYLIFIQNLKF